MNRKVKAFLSLAVVALVLTALVFVSVKGIGPDGKFSAAAIKRGLDLEGGVSITYQTTKEDPTSEEMADTRYKLQMRVDNYSTEAAVYQEGNNRIGVDIPGVSNAEEILQELGKAGSIYFVTMDGEIAIDGSDIEDAKAMITEGENGVGKDYVVWLKLTEEGKEKMRVATAANIGKQIAIIYDEEVISAPTVMGTITEGETYISGQRSFEEAEILASTIRIGALPLELVELRSTVVGAQLGAEAVSTSLLAGAIGFACVILFMIVYYRVPGFASSLALIIYVGLMVVFLNLFEVTLTLQGIAGIILSIGMAVDANVIIFQRIREELATGKTVRSAMRLGFDKAMSAIVDGNVTTLIAAFVLYALGSGGVKGFAITLAIGIILSMFTALAVTRFILNALYDIGLDHEKLYGIQKERKTLPFTKHAVKFALVSVVIILAGVGTMVLHSVKGQDALNYGLDFKGGTSLSVTFPEEITGSLNKELEGLVSDTLSMTSEIVQVTGENTYIIKTIELSQEQRALLADALVSEYNVDPDLIETENISGKVSNEMRADAVKAVVVATFCMLIYIWIRFRNVNFAVSAVTALIHDVLVVLAVYAVGRIAVGNTFIACMLTIVGYSINATIVIFDRIREKMAEREEGETISDIVDSAVTDTLSRSINSSLTTFIMVVMLAVFGVESIREFAVPLMAGIIAGAWSSVCLTGAFWYFMETKVNPHKEKAEEEEDYLP